MSPSSSHHDYTAVRLDEILLGGLLGALVALAGVSTICIVFAGPFHGWHELIAWPHHASIVHRILHTLALLAPIIGALLGGWLLAQQEAVQHVRGMQFHRDPEESSRVLQACELARMSKAQRKGPVRGLFIAGVELSRRRESEHIMVIGLPGYGKTTGLFLPTLDQVSERGDRVILHDPKGDLTAARYQESTCVLLGPWDARARLWDISADIADPALVDEFATALCHADARAAGQNLSFHIGAALLLGGLIKARMADGQDWSWTTLAEDLALMPQALIQRAAQGDALVRQAMPTVFSHPDGELTRGESASLSILGISGRMIQQFAAVERGDAAGRRFSLRRWLLGSADTDIQTVILNNNAQFKSSAAAIFGAMLKFVASLAASAALSEQSADAAGLWFLLDEARQLGPAGLSAVTTLAEVGRSRGVRVVLGLQDASQLTAEVGAEQATPMLSVQGMQIYTRVAAPSATTIAESLGEREVLRLQSTASAGAVTGKTQVHERLPVCTPADFTGLTARRMTSGELEIEMLVRVDDLLCKLAQRVDPARYAPICPSFAPSAAWSCGTLALLATSGLTVQPAANADPDGEFANLLDASRKE
jgi:hypothetical protein